MMVSTAADTGEQGEEADCNDGVMGCGDNSSETPCPSFEADGDVGEDREQGDGYGYQGVALHIVCDGRTYLVGLDDTVRILEGGDELIVGDGVGEEALQSLIQLGVHDLVGLSIM